MTDFIPYVTFMKHAQKVTRSASEHRPALKTVIHRDKYVAVTDSFRLYKATGIYEGEEKQIDPITGLDVDNGEYPNIERLLPEDSAVEHSIKVDALKLYETVRAIEIISRINRTTDRLALEFNEDYFSIKTDDEVTYASVKLVEGTRKPADIKTIYADIRYVKEALMVLKEAKAEDVTVNFHGNMRPFTFDTGNFTALIMPIRKNY